MNCVICLSAHLSVLGNASLTHFHRKNIPKMLQKSLLSYTTIIHVISGPCLISGRIILLKAAFHRDKKYYTIN